ncbi:phosphate/phosphite/phosphonate ABC transporter substrate-binding protein, partial [Thermodesulfobacteriota bacterium]
MVLRISGNFPASSTVPENPHEKYNKILALIIITEDEYIMITQLFKFFLAVILLFFAITPGFQCFAANAAPQEESITIGLIPEMNVFKQRKRFEPLAAYLSKHMGITVKLSILSRYGNIIERIKEEHFDGAFLGSFTGALAISQLGVVPLARPINKDGTSTYYGHIFVRGDSNIKSAADMKGKTLALVERATTAGYVFPLAWFKRQGIDNIDTYFKEYYFTGSHD